MYNGKWYCMTVILMAQVTGTFRNKIKEKYNINKIMTLGIVAYVKRLSIVYTTSKTFNIL